MKLRAYAASDDVQDEVLTEESLFGLFKKKKPLARKGSGPIPGGGQNLHPRKRSARSEHRSLRSVAGGYPATEKLLASIKARDSRIEESVSSLTILLNGTAKRMDISFISKLDEAIRKDTKKPVVRVVELMLKPNAFKAVLAI